MFKLFYFIATQVFKSVDFTVLLVLLCHCVPTDTLIRNGGFDERTKCPTSISQIRLSTDWLNSGSPDLFCTCSLPKASVYAELNFAGSMLPVSGECYAGIIVNSRYKEYLIYELPKKLRKRRTYCISFLYARSVFCGVKTESLGVYVHREMYRNSTRGAPLHLNTATSRIVDNPGVWTPVSFTFTCKGGERFISLGSFSNDLTIANHLPYKMNKKNARVFKYASSAYYYIENVSLAALRDGETCQPPVVLNDTASSLILPQEPHLADTIVEVDEEPFVLHQLNFETAKSVILPGSFDELDELADHLSSQPELNLLITGHTDNRGNENTNLLLSEARANAVAAYLVTRGITSDRLRAIGYGQTRPAADNDTEEGRAMNRRVEFQFE